VPLTDRTVARSVSFTTAHDAGAMTDADWAALARPGHTAVFYMGVGRAGAIRDQLMAHGRPAETPTAIIENATTPAQRCIRGALASLPALVRDHEVRAPATIIVGETAGLEPSLEWFRPSEEPAGSGKVFGESALAFG
jgi:siroheme synthase